MIIQETPTLNLQFDKAKNDSDMLSLLKSQGGTFTRGSEVVGSGASVASYVDALGTVRLAKLGHPRPNFVDGVNQGLLIEEARTNDVRNNTMQGAVVGGALPNRWATPAFGGLSNEVVGVGVEKGVNYIDLRIYGTSTGGNYQVRMGVPTDAVSTISDTWASSMYLALIANVGAAYTTLSGLFYQFDGGVFNNASTEPLTLNNDLTRYGFVKTAGTAGTDSVGLGIIIELTNTVAYDFTIRIGMPQLEKGAFVTSVIPTAGTTVTRGADNALIDGTAFSDFYNQEEGTFVASYSLLEANLAAQTVSLVNDGTNDNRLLISANIFGGNYGVFIETDDIIQFSENFGLSQKNTNYQLGVSYKKDDCFVVNQEGIIKTIDSVILPLVNRVEIGGNITGDARKLNGTIKRLIYYPKALLDTELQLLTRI